MKAKDKKCLVCGGQDWVETEILGWVYCIYCGVPYWKIRNELICEVAPYSFICVIKKYYKETKKMCGLNSWLLTRNWKARKEREQFIDWLKVHHPEELQEITICM